MEVRLVADGVGCAAALCVRGLVVDGKWGRRG